MQFSRPWPASSLFSDGVVFQAISAAAGTIANAVMLRKCKHVCRSSFSLSAAGSVTPRYAPFACAKPRVPVSSCGGENRTQ